MSLLLMSHYLTCVREDDQGRTFNLQREISGHRLQLVIDASNRTLDQRFTAEAWRLIAALPSVCSPGCYFIATTERQPQTNVVRLQRLPTPLAVLIMVEDPRFGIVPTQERIVLVKKKVNIEVFPEHQYDGSNKMVGLGYRI